MPNSYYIWPKQWISSRLTFNLVSFKVITKSFFKYIPNGRRGGWSWKGPKVDVAGSFYSWMSGSSSLLSSLLWLSATGVGLSSTLLSSFSCCSFSIFLNFQLLVESSSDVFLFLSCWYCLPPFLCYFFPDMAQCTLLLGIPYFLAISAWDFLLTIQSLTTIKSNADCSPMLLMMLCSFLSILSPCTFGSYSSCTYLCSSSYCCPYTDNTFSSVVTLTMGSMGISVRWVASWCFLICGTSSTNFLKLSPICW